LAQGVEYGAALAVAGCRLGARCRWDEEQRISGITARRREHRRPFYGWAIVAVGILVAFSSGPGQSYGFSVFLDSIIEATGFSRTGVSTLYAIGTGVSALLVVVISRLADRYGPRAMMIVVAALLGVACFAMATATGPLMIFFAFAALRALGQGSLPVNATLLVAQWFVRYRGRAMALVGLGFAASNALIPPVSRLLIDLIGWRGAYAALGVMVWLLVIPAALLVVRNRPEDMGLHPDGTDEPPAEAVSATRAGAQSGGGDRRVLTSLPFWLLAIPMSAPSFIVTALVFHQVSIFEERGLSAGVAAGVFVAYAIASAGTGLLAGFLVDRLGPKNVFIANLGVLLAAMLVLQVVRNPVLAVLYAAVLGASGGIQSVVSGVTWVHYYGREGLGKVQGSAMMVNISGAAIGPLPIAALQARTGDYSLGILAMIVLLLACIVMAVTVSGRGLVEQPAG
jgi:MFS family permease